MRWGTPCCYQQQSLWRKNYCSFVELGISRPLGWRGCQETKPYAVCLELDIVSFETLFSLTQEFFIDPLDPTDVELTMFEIEYSEYAKDKYVEIVNYYKGLGENK